MTGTTAVLLRRALAGSAAGKATEALTRAGLVALVAATTAALRVRRPVPA